MEDMEIIALYEERSAFAIAKTSEKYGSYLMKICMNILNIKQDSEECVNDTYLATWNKIPPDKPIKFLPYIGRIAKNIALNRYDYLTADKRNTHYNTALDELSDIISGTNNTEDSFVEKELSASISVFLRNSDEKSRNIFIRRYWYNDSIGDVAKMFGISESSTKVTLHRTRKKLKTYLEREGYTI